MITLEVNGSVLTLNTKDAAAVRDRLSGMLAEHKAGRIGVIQTIVADEFGVSTTQLTGRCRSDPICLPRFACYWLCRQFGFSLKTIGSAFNRDHAAVMSGSRRFEAWMATEKKTRAAAERLQVAVGEALKQCRPWGINTC